MYFIKRFILVTLLMLVAIGISAQATGHDEDSKTIEYRQKIGIDYSLPDFDTNKIDGKVIGTRLAKILQKLQNNAIIDNTWSNRIILLCSEQNEKFRFSTLERFNVKRISKSGNVITILFHVKFHEKINGTKHHDIPVFFNQGVSESKVVNEVFSDMSRYIKE